MLLISNYENYNRQAPILVKEIKKQESKIVEKK